MAADLLDIWDFEAFVLRGMVWEEYYLGRVWRSFSTEVRTAIIDNQRDWPQAWPTIYRGSVRGALAVIGIYAWARAHYG